MPPDINLFWEGTQFAYHSFARINRALALNLIRSGLLNVTLVPFELDEFSPDNDPDFETLRAHDLRTKGIHALSNRDRPTVWVRSLFPPRPKTPPQGMKWAAIQPWEYSVMPTIYVDALKRADEVWTSSKFSRDALLRSGLENVYVVPLGVDVEQFSPLGHCMALDTTKTFRFLFVGGTIFRKGIDTLLQSFCRAFNVHDDVCLVIKDAGGSVYRGQTSAQLIHHWQAQPNAPEILYFDQPLADADLAALYRACDVFVAPYRGEGFSLPTLEAMACGLPMIVTNGGATDDFCDEHVGWGVSSVPRPIGNMLYGQSLPGDGFVLEPDAEHLCTLMRQAAHEPETVTAKGIQAALRAASNWTWMHTTRHVITRLDSLCGTSMAHAIERLPLPRVNSDAIRHAIVQKKHAG